MKELAISGHDFKGALQEHVHQTSTFFILTPGPISKEETGYNSDERWTARHTKEKRQSSCSLSSSRSAYIISTTALVRFFHMLQGEASVYSSSHLLITGRKKNQNFLAVNSAAASDPMLLGSNEFSPVPFTCPLGLGGKSVQLVGLLCAALINNEPSGACQRAW